MHSFNVMRGNGIGVPISLTPMKQIPSDTRRKIAYLLETLSSMPHTEPHIIQNVSRETFSKIRTWMENPLLTEYAELLLWWNGKVNLVSRSQTKEDVLKHIEHSLCIGPWLEESALPFWVDTGTGGGLPGIPLAIVFPETRFCLNDIVSKKIVVAKAISSALHLQNVEFYTGDIGDLDLPAKSGVVTKHAFKLADLLGRLRLKPWERLLMLKGSDYIDEWRQLTTPPEDARALPLSELSDEPFYQGKYLLELCQTLPTAPYVGSTS